MKDTKFKELTIWIVLLVISVSASAATEIKNIIYCIGDGMGPNHIAYARHILLGQDGKFNLETLPVVGVVRTYCANSIITDSAAGGTALACGIKTNKGMVGMDPNGIHYSSILELLNEKGWATGLVVTSQVSHATPAAFASHVKTRNNQNEIAKQMLENRLDIMFGGGHQYWLPKSENGKRGDEIDLVKCAESYGYCVIQKRPQLLTLDKLPAIGLFAKDGMKTDDTEPTIAQMSSKAIELLDKKNNNGFFLMIEGSQIDWESHKNDDDKMITQLKEFDLAVKEAIDFAKKDGSTLVIVTADHETGGLIIQEDSNIADGEWETTYHTAGDVLIFSMGPGSKLFAGVMNNIEIPKKIADLTGIKDFPVTRTKK